MSQSVQVKQVRHLPNKFKLGITFEQLAET